MVWISIHSSYKYFKRNGSPDWQYAMSYSYHRLCRRCIWVRDWYICDLLNETMMQNMNVNGGSVTFQKEHIYDISAETHFATHSIYHTFAYGFIALCFAAVILLTTNIYIYILVCDPFTHILHGCFIVTGAITRLPRIQWRSLGRIWINSIGAKSQ